MTSKQRITAALAMQPTDRVPVNHRGFSGRAAGHILGRDAFVGGGFLRYREALAHAEGWHDDFLERSYQDACAISAATGQDMLRAKYWSVGEMPAPTRQLDEHTFLFEDEDGRRTRVLRFDPGSEQCAFEDHPPRTLEVADLRQMQRCNERATDAYRPSADDFPLQLRALRDHGHEKEIEASGAKVNIGIPLENMDAWLEAMILDPPLVHALIATQVERAVKVISFLAKQGLRVFIGGCDLAGTGGPFYAPRMFQSFVLPGLRRICAHCDSVGVYYAFASDGDLWPLADMLFGASGVRAFLEIDRDAGMDLCKLRERFPSLALIGNISSRTLARGSGDDVRREVEACLHEAKRAGGVIAGVSNYIQPETPPRNIDIMLETIEAMR